MLFVLLCCVAALCQGVLGEGELHVKNASELIDFSKNVNNRTRYSGTTVFLDADIDFSGGLSKQFKPIGKDNSNYFQGTFDGQGHTISNLAMDSSSQFAGLFGYSYGATIRNVVLDSSCSVVNSCSGSVNVRLGGVIGHCQASNGPCTFENTVNMASVSFIGSTTGDAGFLCLGGITGYILASNKDVTIKNCANYGSLSHSETASDNSYIGGIVGESDGWSSVYIQNCLNYGTITYNGTSKYLYLGGILGCAYKGKNNIENCVSGGKITSNKARSSYIGSIVGGIYSGTKIITHCYCISEVGNYKACGNSTTDNETSLVSLNTTTVNNLNNYNNSWNKWFLNTNNKSITFKINNGKASIFLHSSSSSLLLLRVKTTPSVAGLKMKNVQRSLTTLLLRLTQFFMKDGAML